MNLHKHQLYLLEQQSESFKTSAIIRINTEGKSLIMKLGPGLNLNESNFCQGVQNYRNTIPFHIQADVSHFYLF